MDNEPTVVRTWKDVNVREVKGGFVVIQVNRNELSNGTVQGIQEDTVAASPKEVIQRVAEFLGVPVS